MLEFREVACPYCGETIPLMLDASAGAQHYIEDCAVCCRPITVVVEMEDDGALALSVYSQDEA